jgi:hypothetical protein
MKKTIIVILLVLIVQVCLQDQIDFFTEPLPMEFFIRYQPEKGTYITEKRWLTLPKQRRIEILDSLEQLRMSP